MSSILFDYHQGLGDHILCHGIVREYCKTYDRVGIFCLPRNYPTVTYMYRDLTNLHIHMVPSYAAKDRYRFFNFIRFGDHHYDTMQVIGDYDQESGLLFERQIYSQVGIDIQKKWDSFYLLRDTEQEESLSINCDVADRCIFVHDDARYSIDRTRISTSLQVFQPNPRLTDNMFDYCTLIERAREIHVIDSSFMFLVDCLPYTNSEQKLFVHRYARLNTPCQMPLLNKPWQILT